MPLTLAKRPGQDIMEICSSEARTSEVACRSGFYRRFTRQTGQNADGAEQHQANYLGKCFGGAAIIMPKLLKLLAINLAIGVFVGLSFMAVLIYTDMAGLGTLIWQSSNPALALFLLGAGMSITFGSAAMGAAVMMLPYDDE